LNTSKAFLRKIGYRLAEYLSQPRAGTAPLATSRPEQLAAALQPGDVLLVDGSSRVSGVIKYLTQSSWSHAALFVGAGYGSEDQNADEKVLLEVDILEGVRLVRIPVKVGQ